jgi:DNA polymerase-3 subunit delta'
VTFTGHDEAWREWRSAMGGPRMHHAWMLAGPRGLGKASFAMLAARELVAEGGVPQPPGGHPDVIILEPLPATPDDEKSRDAGKPYQRKRNISVEQVREMQQRLNTRPTLGSRRAIVIDPADFLEKSAANALLKSLEEPPVGSFFMLVTHRPGRLLPTIRSRCRILRFSRLEDAAIDAILRREAPTADDAVRRAAVAAGAGAPGAALEFVDLGLGEMHSLMREIAELGDPDFARRGRLAEVIGARPDRKKQLAAIDLARGVVSARMRETTRTALPALAEAHASLVRLSGTAPTYNYDPGLLLLEIGGLLASVAAPREPAHG